MDKKQPGKPEPGKQPPKTNPNPDPKKNTGPKHGPTVKKNPPRA